MAGRDVSAPEQIKHYNLEVFDRSDDDGELWSKDFGECNVTMTFSGDM